MELDKYVIASDLPAEEWSQSTLIGNGHNGAAVYGGISEDVIGLTDISFYSGEKGPDNAQGAAKAFGLMRKALINGDYDSAEEEADYFIGKKGNYGSNLPVGDFIVSYNDLDEHGVLDYSREMHILDGIGRVNIEKEGLTVQREFFAFHQDKTLYYRIESSGSQAVSVRFENTTIPVNYFECEKGFGFKVQALEKIHSDGHSGVCLTGAVQVAHSDGSVEVEGSGISIKDMTYCTLAIKTITEFDYESKDCIGIVDEEVLLTSTEYPPYDRLRQQHVDDFGSRMKRVSLSLSGHDDLTERMFQYGRYLLLSSSREDSILPAHLQGIWNDNVACQIGWTCDMHLDINTQMNYWLCEAGNLSECHEPLFRWMEQSVIPSGRVTAKESYGLDGWSADLVSNPWGFTAPYWSKTISPCPTGGIWTASHFWEHYLYGQDRNFLKNHVRPVIEEAVVFFSEYVFPNGAFYACGPSISPENSFTAKGKRYYFDLDTTYELSAIREVFQTYCQLMAILGEGSALLDKVVKIQASLHPYVIDEDGCISEYAKHAAYDRWHRHMSHLLGLFPYAHITPEETPELAEAAYKSVRQKMEPYERWEDTGWARSMLMLYMARLHKGNEALWHIKEMQKHLTNQCDLVMHPPTRGAPSFKEVYELDGNTGLSMCVIEMLMQSHSGRIHLLPALPDDWPSGSIQGLRARGGIEVNMTWVGGRLIEAVFTSKENQQLNVTYMGRTESLALTAGQARIYRSDES